MNACKVTFFSLSLISLIAVNLAFPTHIQGAEGDTLKYIPWEDFDDLNAGDVPYYIEDDNGRKWSVTINPERNDAKNPEKWAAMTMAFEGESGVYNVRVQGFGEDDGNSFYRFFVNDSMIVEGQIEEWDGQEGWCRDSAAARFGLTTRDEIKEVYHILKEHAIFAENVRIETGDEIRIASRTHSNDGKEYARGRVIYLELVTVPETGVLHTAYFLDRSASIGYTKHLFTMTGNSPAHYLNGRVGDIPGRITRGEQKHRLNNNLLLIQQ
jgi:hypothetical protein